MRLLVLGGTMFLSRATAQEAVRLGHEVTCACRGNGPLPDGVRHLPLDRSTDDPADVLGPTAGEYDAVVAGARRHSWVAPAVAAVPQAHWVFVSTISVYADNHTLNGSPTSLPVLEAITDDRDLGSGPDVYGGM